MKLRCWQSTAEILIQAGLKEGPMLGKILEQLTEAVIDDQALNTKEQLIQKALDMEEKIKD